MALYWGMWLHLKTSGSRLNRSISPADGSSLRRRWRRAASAGASLTWPRCLCTAWWSLKCASRRAPSCWTWRPPHCRRLLVSKLERWTIFVLFCFTTEWVSWATPLPPHTETITDSHIESGQLKADLKEQVMYTLLRKHRHQTKKSNLRSLADIGKSVSSASRLFSSQENGSVEYYAHSSPLILLFLSLKFFH